MVGDLVSDAMRSGTGADVALLNSGTLRLDNVIQPGPISNHQLEAIFPFADQTRVVTFPLSGAGLRRILEHGVSSGVLGTGGFLQVSGLSFTFDPSKPSGRRLVGDIRRAFGARWGRTTRSGSLLGCIRRVKGVTAIRSRRPSRPAPIGSRPPERSIY